MIRLRLVLTVAATFAMLAACTGGGDDRNAALSAVEQKERKKEYSCSETADHVLGKPKDTIYAYVRSDCLNAHAAKDPTPADSDWGDGAGWIKDFDNDADSLINNSKYWVAFYSKPDYKGDAFCVGPGRWVNKLYLYGDSEGSWSNSISSHKRVSGKKCSRRFG
ncbi:peptidase inhibitor family I36 protein [Flindersiella endophytica]